MSSKLHVIINKFRGALVRVLRTVSPAYRASTAARITLDQQQALLNRILKETAGLRKIQATLSRCESSIQYQQFPNNYPLSFDANVIKENRKIKIYIISYKRNDVLNKNLQTLWMTASDPYQFDVTIVANHPDIEIYQENKRGNLRVLLNNTRMPHAWGYLSRDWNFCILDCFKTWRNPNNVKWCLMLQNDVEWNDGWQQWLEKNTKYDFISQPKGDQLLALNIEAIKKVGFFDERFSTLHFQEQDYFIRASCLLGDRVSINDTHKSIGNDNSINYVGNVLSKTGCFGINDRDPELHVRKTNSMFMAMMQEKYGFEGGLDCFRRKYAREHVAARGLEKTEMNWYPFFWDGYKDIESTFLFNDK